MQTKETQEMRELTVEETEWVSGGGYVKAFFRGVTWAICGGGPCGGGGGGGGAGSPGGPRG